MAKLTFKEDECKGCGLCVSFCPKGVLALAQNRINAKGHHPVEAAEPALFEKIEKDLFGDR